MDMSQCPQPNLFAISIDAWASYSSTWLVVLSGHAAFFISALLVTLPNTRALRLAFLPLASILVVRMAGLLVHTDDAGVRLALMTWVTAMLFRMLPWAFERAHFTRGGSGARTMGRVLLDTIDLCFTFRGTGWSFSESYRHTYPALPPTITRRAFLGMMLREYVINALLYDAYMFFVDYVYAVDAPAPVKRLVASQVYGVGTYLSMSGQTQIFYRLPGVFILRQHPEEYPDMFDAPYRSTSLKELWGRRWHQCFRYILTSITQLVVPRGRAAQTLVAFALSAVYHDMGMWSMRFPSGLCCAATPLFMASGVGVVLEGAYTMMTGKKVGGWLGWVWTFGWLQATAYVIADVDCVQHLYTTTIKVHVLLRPVHGLLKAAGYVE